MASYTGVLYPVPEFYQPPLTTSLAAGLDRPHDYQLGEIAPAGNVLAGTVTRIVGGTARTPRTGQTAYVIPTWADYLFGNILLRPPRLDLGNLLSSQTRSVEIANLYLTARVWTAASSPITGVTLNNLPAFSFTIPAFGSFVLQVGIAADGPVTISGSIEFDFDVVTLYLPVTGKRVVLWQFIPLVPITETLEWKTDVLEAWDGTEQRASLRAAPRQRIRMSHAKFDDIEGRVRALLFDWLARPFAIPIWWEARGLTSPASIADSTIYVPTDSADFVVGNLVMIYTSDKIFEAVEITTINPSNLVLSSQLGNAYAAGALVVPMRTAFAKTVPAQSRVVNAGSVIDVDFTTITATNHADTTGSTLYGSKVLLDDPNLFDSGINDTWDRTVKVNDSGSGRVLQTSSKDRSHYRTGKIWDAPTRAEVWRVRRLLHAFAGSRVSFFMPSFRADLKLSEQIGASSTTLRVLEASYATYMKSRRPFGDLRLVRRNGTAAVRNVIGAVVDGAEEVLTVDSPFDATHVIDPSEVISLQFVNMFRIADDQATFLHRLAGDATVSVNLVSVKE
jgi:hypothetical protein